eukprot:CAMPEP_0172360616 /NCGR_PEP_ID=MMETSP1060-20121228/4613_1 /TAXON_ID=37318 /ORGANISM="Pseudo-nitzschia pungens, Strain cf. cingulata" /LENGTH=180 /DNA_ID=CAMNT_0013082657 /DNA_START=122 /DNA_END=664 /DNA_ORIENTATION=-
MSGDSSAKKEIDGAADATAESGGVEPQMEPLFKALKENENATLSFAGGFRDKVRILFEHFDVDGDGRLRYNELAALQIATNDSGDDESSKLSKEMYVMACQSLNCHPDQGLSLEAIKFTYAAEGADIDADYEKVFDKDGKPRKVVVLLPTKKEETKEPKNKNDNDDDKVYEVGANGVDIS